MAKLKEVKYEIKWRDRKRTFLGLPWSFTVYMLLEDKLLITTGFFNKHEEEIRLYRIMDITLERKLGQRLFGLGTIHLCSSDKTTPEVNIKSVKQSKAVKELFSNLVEEARKKNRVTAREFMDGDVDVDDVTDHDTDN